MVEKKIYPDSYYYEEEPCHGILAKNAAPALAYNESADYATWKKSVRKKLVELTGLDRIAANAVSDPALCIEHTKEMDGYTEIRFTFESEVGYRVPCYLLIPNDGKEKHPVAITLQGHSTGFHNSVGIVKYESDIAYQPRGQFGVQAVRRGWAALCIEQRGMGERRPRVREGHKTYRDCAYTALQALQLGRTILGERIWDVHCAINLLEREFTQCDTSRVLITGNSGGGTASYYSACFDERIGICAPSCAFCPYEPSILAMFHCSCNYIPNALCYFDMQDLACLIAPRRLSVVAGQLDNIFPIEGVRKGFETVRRIYEKEGVPSACTLTETPKNHWWCEDLVWGEIDRVAKELNWK